MEVTATRTVIRSLTLALAGLAAVLVIAGIYFSTGALARERPRVTAGTVHPTLSRESCLECHAPIAAEWRESFHFRSVTGPFWARVRNKGFADVFTALRVPCMNCHAPANVLDVAEDSHPVEREEAAELGVDCVSCHVSEAGIMGSGRSTEAPHEVIADQRFTDATLASTTLCARCHDEDGEQGKVVSAWQQTRFAADGVTCLDCHMPRVDAPIVAGGPVRSRRSHSFIADKDEGMLRRALNASIAIGDGRAVVRIVNDRVGHALPAGGMNWLIASVEARDRAGRVSSRVERGFGSAEWIPGYLDFWPFLKVTKIPHGEGREIVVELPPGHGRVSAEFRYRDWFTVKDRDVMFSRITKDY